MKRVATRRRLFENYDQMLLQAVITEGTCKLKRHWTTHVARTNWHRKASKWFRYNSTLQAPRLRTTKNARRKRRVASKLINERRGVSAPQYGKNNCVPEMRKVFIAVCHCPIDNNACHKNELIYKSNRTRTPQLEFLTTDGFAAWCRNIGCKLINRRSCTMFESYGCSIITNKSDRKEKVTV